jgi:hypothetical protein
MGRWEHQQPLRQYGGTPTSGSGQLAGACCRQLPGRPVRQADCRRRTRRAARQRQPDRQGAGLQPRTRRHHPRPRRRPPRGPPLQITHEAGDRSPRINGAELSYFRATHSLGRSNPSYCIVITKKSQKMLGAQVAPRHNDETLEATPPGGSRWWPGLVGGGRVGAEVAVVIEADFVSRRRRASTPRAGRDWQGSW